MMAIYRFEHLRTGARKLRGGSFPADARLFPFVPDGIKRLPDAMSGLRVGTVRLPQVVVEPDSGVEGTGIGLALSQRLVLAMGGSIGVDSEVGSGSLFWIRLPSAVIAGQGPAQVAKPQIGSEEPPVGPKRPVLYIEDNIVNISLMQAILSQLSDVELTCAESPQEGLHLAHALKPDLILTDIQLPGMDGLAVLAKLRADEATRSIPVVAVSANALQSDVDAALAAGFQSYVTKPLDLDLLVSTVRQHLLRVN